VPLIYDTKLDTALAVKLIGEAHASGLRYFVGPQSSAELAAIRSFSNASESLVISQGSTAGTLAIANDAIFRFCPGDSIEGGAVARSVFALGYEYLITVSRNDAGNLDLQRVVGQKFSSLGGTTEIMSPYAVNETDYSALLSSLKAKIQAGISLYGVSKVGVYLVSFDECVQLFRQASLNPVFSSVRWFGGDGVVLSGALVGDAQAAAFAAATQFFAPNFGLPASSHPDLDRVVASIRSRTNIEPDAYALAAYDTVWVIT
jgi:branched-chain amino acid transport system substrate-binding protein